MALADRKYLNASNVSRFLFLATLTMVIGYLAFAPLNLERLPTDDKQNHILAFLVLALASGACGFNLRRQLIHLTLLALLLEGLQTLPFIGREASWSDAAASQIGLIIGLGTQLGLAVPGRWARSIIDRARPAYPADAT